MAVVYLIGWLIAWCCATFLKPKPHQAFYPAKRKTDSSKPDDDHDAKDTLTPKSYRGFRRKKPQWVIDEVIYLKAIHPLTGCRKLADIFNRLYAATRNTTVSKSYVYDRLKKHRYEVQVLRRFIKHRRPKRLPRNVCWGIDLTTVTDALQQQHLIFAIVDYGTRRCLCLQLLSNKCSFTLLWYLLNAVRTFGRPKSIKTDNEAVFTSYLFKATLCLMNIKHRLSDIASPWQNGRVERMIGTFKEKITPLLVRDQHQLASLLPEFLFWYNAVRPHQYLDGKTPLEVWHGVDVFNERYKRLYRFDAWDGLLTGDYLLT
jgi:hypothetical protein